MRVPIHRRPEQEIRIRIGVAICTIGLWSGTAHGQTTIRQLADLNPGQQGSFPADWSRLGSGVFFSAYTLNTGRELWLYTGGTITLVSNINDTADDVGYGILEGNDSNATAFTEFDGTLYFSAFDPRRGGELWRTDGRTTIRVADINPDPNDVIKLDPASSWPSELTVLGNRLVFAANGGGPWGNYELYDYDGAVVRRVANIHPDTGTNYSSFPQRLTVFGDAVFFMADDGVNGYELWKYTGTSALMVTNLNPGGASSSSFPQHFTRVNDRLYFQAFHAMYGYELWESDGVTVSLAADLNPGEASGVPEALTAFNGALFFRATDGQGGHELWRYENSVADRVTDIHPWGDAFPKNLTVFNQELCFAAADGVNGWELWRYDGASAVLVTNLHPSGDAFPEQFTVYAGSLYFVATTPQTGYELWKYDGMTVTLAADLNPGPGSSFPQKLVALNGALFFRAAEDGWSNWEPWTLSVPGANPVERLMLQRPGLWGDEFVFTFASEVGRTYVVEFTDALGTGEWQPFGTVIADRATISVTNTHPWEAQRFYRVEIR